MATPCRPYSAATASRAGAHPAASGRYTADPASPRSARMSSGARSPTAVGLVSVRSSSGPAARASAAAHASGFRARSHAVRLENMEDWFGRELRVSYASLMRLRSLAAMLGLAALSAGCIGDRPRSAPSPSPMSVTPITAPSPSPLPDPLPLVLATVDGRPIPLRSARIIAQQSFGGRTPSDAERATAYRLALEQLIARELLYQEALRRKIQPD